MDFDGAHSWLLAWLRFQLAGARGRIRCARWPTCWKPCARAITPSAPAAFAGDDALGEVMQQVNMMSATLRAQRLGAMEATTLLRKVMEEIEVAVFAFDGEQKLRLVNRSGERLLGRACRALLVAQERGIAGLGGLPGRANRSRTVQRTFPGAVRPLGHQPEHVSRRRTAAPIAGRDRSHAPFARRGTESLAAPGSRAGP